MCAKRSRQASGMPCCFVSVRLWWQCGRSVGTCPGREAAVSVMASNLIGEGLSRNHKDPCIHRQWVKHGYPRVPSFSILRHSSTKGAGAGPPVITKPRMFGLDHFRSAEVEGEAFLLAWGDHFCRSTSQDLMDGRDWIAVDIVRGRTRRFKRWGGPAQRIIDDHGAVHRGYRL